MSEAGDLLTRIPQRRPWSLVDRVVAIEGGEVRAEKWVTLGDPLVGDALPDVLVVEALAQAAACLNAASDGEGVAHQGYLVALRNFVFEGRVLPGDCLELRLSREAQLGGLHRFRGEASVAGRRIAGGELTFAVGAQPSWR